GLCAKAWADRSLTMTAHTCQHADMDSDEVPDITNITAEGGLTVEAYDQVPDPYTPSPTMFKIGTGVNDPGWVDANASITESNTHWSYTWMGGHLSHVGRALWVRLTVRDMSNQPQDIDLPSGDRPTVNCGS